MGGEQVKELRGGQEPCLALLCYKALVSTAAEDGIEAKLPTTPKINIELCSYWLPVEAKKSATDF